MVRMIMIISQTNVFLNIVLLTLLEELWVLNTQSSMMQVRGTSDPLESFPPVHAVNTLFHH